MHGTPKEVFTSKMWDENESFLRYKKKEWLKLGMWLGKSYIDLWNIVAVPNSNLLPCASMYRIKRERIINCFRRNQFLCNVQHKEQKSTIWKRVAKVWN